MPRLLSFICAALAALLLGACDGTPEVQPGTLGIRVTHAAPDAPKVNIEIQGLISALGSSVLGPLGTLTLQAVDYKSSSGLVAVRVGNTAVRVEAIIPGGNVQLADLSFPEDENLIYDVIAVNNWASIELLQLPPNPVEAITDPANFRTQIVNAAVNAGDLVFYFTPFGDPLAAGQGLSFKDFTQRAESAAGDYQIRVALAADPMNPVFDSGEQPFPPRLDLLILLVDNTVTGSSPITVLIQDGAGTSEIFDIDTTSDIRFVHTLPDDTGSLDIIINDDTMNPAVAGLTFGSFTDYLDPALMPNVYNFKFVDSADPDTIIINQNLTLDIGTARTVLAEGFIARAPLLPAFTVDDNRRIATEARLRVLHASNAAGLVDIYLAKSGAAIGEDNLVFENVAFFTTTGYGSLTGDDYKLSVTEANNISNVLVDALPITLMEAGIYTAVAVDTASAVPGEATLPLEFIFLDDFPP